MDDTGSLVAIEIAVADQDVFLRADGSAQVEADDAFPWVCCDRVDALPAFVGGDAET